MSTLITVRVNKIAAMDAGSNRLPNFPLVLCLGIEVEGKSYLACQRARLTGNTYEYLQPFRLFEVIQYELVDADKSISFHADQNEPINDIRINENGRIKFIGIFGKEVLSVRGVRTKDKWLTDAQLNAVIFVWEDIMNQMDALTKSYLLPNPVDYLLKFTD